MSATKLRLGRLGAAAAATAYFQEAPRTSHGDAPRTYPTPPTQPHTRTSDPALLPHTHDRYNGILTPGTDTGALLPHSSDEFDRLMATSLSAWKSNGHRGIWLTLPPDLLHHAPLAVSKFAFSIHSASKEHGLLLTRWLPDDVPNTLPAPASSYVGVGCLVLSLDKTKVLLVQERNGVLKDTNFWKIPTGAVDTGEGLEQACTRELFEETGIVAVPRGVVLMRHAARFLNGKADIFVIFLMELSPGASEELCIQESEIAAAKWVPLEEYFAQDLSALWPAGQVAYRCMNRAMRGALADPASVLPATYYNAADQSAIFHPIFAGEGESERGGEGNGVSVVFASARTKAP